MFGPDVLADGSPDHTAMRAIRSKMTIPPVMEDVGAMIDYIEGQDMARDGAVGVHGYCLSGPFALAAAARYPDRVKAAASVYGTWLVNDAEESPHLTFSQVKGEVYIACAEFDHVAPLDMVDELRRCFAEAGSPGEIEMYEDVHHGFAFPNRPAYDQPAAERHWERLFALYGKL